MQVVAITVCVLMTVLETASQREPLTNNCSYIPGYCLSSDNCDSNKICRGSKCVDPCALACGPHTVCHVVDHIPMCSCNPRSSGHPLSGCEDPNTSGCTSNHQCPLNLACLQRQCQDPCLTYCGLNSVCLVRNHSPACSCQVGFTGNPFIACHPDNDEDRRRKMNKKEFYLFTHIKMNWYQALAHCASVNLSLASIDNQEEYDIVHDRLKNANAGKVSFWLSGTDLGQTGWVYVTSGKPMTFAKWFGNQPDNYKWGDEVEHCLELHEDQDFLMNDRICSMPNFVVCESRVYDC